MIDLTYTKTLSSNNIVFRYGFSDLIHDYYPIAFLFVPLLNHVTSYPGLQLLM